MELAGVVKVPRCWLISTCDNTCPSLGRCKGVVSERSAVASRNRWRRTLTRVKSMQVAELFVSIPPTKRVQHGVADKCGGVCAARNGRVSGRLALAPLHLYCTAPHLGWWRHHHTHAARGTHTCVKCMNFIHANVLVVAAEQVQLVALR